MHSPTCQVEAQKGLTAGSSMGLVESESNTDLASVDPGFTQSQMATVEISTALAEERDREIQTIVSTIVELAQASAPLQVHPLKCSYLGV